MYINNLLIDSVEVDFRFCDTQKKREERVEELCHYLGNEHFSKSFVAHQEPNFIMIAESKVNNIIREDEFKNKLVPELENELDQLKKLQISKTKLRICK